MLILPTSSKCSLRSKKDNSKLKKNEIHFQRFFHLITDNITSCSYKLSEIRENINNFKKKFLYTMIPVQQVEQSWTIVKLNTASSEDFKSSTGTKTISNSAFKSSLSWVNPVKSCDKDPSCPVQGTLRLKVRIDNMLKL